MKKEKKFSVKDYQPLPQHVQEVDYVSLTLLHTLCVECPELPWVKAVAPAIVQKIKPHPEQKFIPTLKAPSEKMKHQSTVTSVKYSHKEKSTIEKLTRKQEDSV